MLTSRFCHTLGIPERSWRRWQARQRDGSPPKGPWPAPQRERIAEVACAYADRWPAWGHRKIATLLRVDGYACTDATVLRALRDRGKTQPVDAARQRRQLAAARKAAFAAVPTGHNTGVADRLQ